MYANLLPDRFRAAYRASPSKERFDRIATRLLEGGYRQSTVGMRFIEWVRFDLYCAQRSVVLPDSLSSPVVRTYSQVRAKERASSTRHIRTALRILLERDYQPGTMLRKQHLTTALHDEVVPPFVAFLRNHRGVRDPRGYELYLRQFFLWLHGKSIKSLRSIRAVHLRDFLCSLSKLTRAVIQGIASRLRRFVSYLHLHKLITLRIEKGIEAPRVYANPKPPPVLPFEAVERILQAAPRDTGLQKRNYVVLLLAARYGLRPSDIRRLRLEDIFWRENRITLVQSKTETKLELPLLPEVEDALVDYLKNGRPESPAREILLRHIPPFGPLSHYHNIWQVMDEAMRRARIEAPSRGLRLLRHAAATHMMKSGVSFEMISSFIGHRSPTSTQRYIAADVDTLRVAALSEAEAFR